MINVTKPFLPPIEEYKKYIDGIWSRNWLTNNGPLVNELELRLKEYLQVDHMLFLGNGTIGLQIAIKALGLSGEIITTPFSYVATTSSIVWENCTPVFADIHKDSLNIDPLKLEQLITSQTSAILATHVYGNPCDIDAIQEVADKYKLKVIYDAAHCFGTKYKGESIFKFGDISIASFHSTKLFHTIEGGAVFTSDPELLKKMSFLRNFGHNGPEVFSEVGINGKNSEFHAAMGLVNLKYVDAILEDRKRQYLYYNKVLSTLNCERLVISKDADFNYSYYPIRFADETSLLKSVKALNDNWIYPRRYFFPCLNKLPYVESNRYPTPIAEDISKRILCLSMYHGLQEEEMDFIARILLRVQNN